MVKLIDPRKIKTISLSSFPDSQVEVFESLLTGDARAISAMKDASDQDKGIFSLIRAIKSWNFTDDQDKPLEINAENIGKLPQNDMIELMRAFAGEEMDKVLGAKK